MGPVLLRIALTAGCLLIAACTGEDAPAPADSGAADPHAQIACRRCHTPSTLPSYAGAVPANACASAGCHDHEGPGIVTVHEVQVDHGLHLSEDVGMECSSCHAHDAGKEPLAVSFSSCAVCHQDDMVAATGDCTRCHNHPTDVVQSRLGVEIPHARLPSLGLECRNCHFDVLAAARPIPPERCSTCHETRGSIDLFEADGEQIHDVHSAVGCQRCHESSAHWLTAMKQALELDCRSCHPDTGSLAAIGCDMDRDCLACHEGVHADQQRWLLGLVDVQTSHAADKFLDGLSCRSCHSRWETRETSGRVARVTSDSCLDCHVTEMRPVFSWWKSGIEQRTALVRQELETASKQLAKSRDLDRAEALLADVATDRGFHNPVLTHDALVEAQAAIRAAYASASLPEPSFANLGAAPERGLCSSCHYDPSQETSLENMDDALHQRLREARTRAAEKHDGR